MTLVRFYLLVDKLRCKLGVGAGFTCPIKSPRIRTLLGNDF